jgi:hypothetical protein
MSSQTYQNHFFSRFYNFANKLFELALDPGDMITFYQAKKVVKASSFLKHQLTQYMSVENAAGAVFLASNLGILYYQYCYSSWFLYLLTTFSGIKKLYQVILQNPLLGVFFYLSFYFRLLTETDKEKFNAVAKVLGLPSHDSFSGSTLVKEWIQNVVPNLMKKFKWVNLKNIQNINVLLQNVVLEQLVAKTVENSPKYLTRLLKKVATSGELTKLPASALYVSKHTLETRSELEEFLNYVREEHENILKHVSRQKGSKQKSKRKLKLQQLVERKSDTGETLCLNTCKHRVKTKLGCYCEGDCGPTFFFSGKSWCFVDPEKCKRGKYVPRFFGLSYDTCDVSKTTVQPNCYTGEKYKACKVK